MSRRTLAVLLAVAAAVALAGAGAATATPADGSTTAQTADSLPATSGVASQPSTQAAANVQACADSPSDYDDGDLATAENEDVVGWVNGYWYDDELGFDTNQELTQSEVEELAARTAARFEVLRCLTLDEMPDIEVQTREEYLQTVGGQFEDVDDEQRTFDNARMATLLTVGQDRDSIEVFREFYGGAVGGQYAIGENEIIMVSDDPNAVSVNEATLLHELGHAIQDQQFGLGEYDRSTTDLDAATLGLIEGDVEHATNRFETLCQEGYWSEECLISEQGDGSGDAEVPSWGIALMLEQPYYSGPGFVEDLRATGGWDAVNAAYSAPPRTSAAVLEEGLYGSLDADPPSVADESDDAWERVETANGQDHDVLGQAAISSAFMAPTWEEVTRDETVHEDLVVELQDAQNPFSTHEPIEYDLDVSDGWRGDRFYVYEGDDGAAGTVWELQWESADEAEEFVGAYEQLLELRGASGADGERVYAFPDSSEFDMAVAIDVDGDRVTIGTAPTVEAIGSIHAPLADVVADAEVDPGEDGDDAADAAGDDGADADASGDGDDADEGGDDDDGVPGFGVVAAVAALAGAGLLRRRR